MEDTDKYRSIMRLDPGDEKRIFLARKGVFLLDGEITDSSAYVIVTDLLFAHLTEVGPLFWIILKSVGGGAADGLSIIDTIRAIVAKGKEVNILGLGEVASMATAIMQAGTKRYSFPHTQFLVHQVREVSSFFKQEEVNEGEERIEELKRINDVVMKIIADRCGMDLSEIKSLSKKKDCWMDASNALKFGHNGLIDEVITELPF